MLEELEEKDSKDSHWVGVDLCSLYVPKAIDKHFADLVEHGEISFSEDSTYPFPDFGASSLKRKCLDILCSKQWESIRNKLRPLGRTPTALFVLKQREVLSRVVRAVASYYSAESLRRIGARVKVIEQQSEAKTSNSDTCKNDSLEELTGNDVLVEAGVKTALSVVFSLLRQAWVQVAWQKQLEERVKQSGATDMVLPSAISLPNEVLQSFLAILNSLPDLSLSNRRMLSRLSLTFLDQANEFLQTVIGPNSQADSRGKQLALEILFSLTLQEGSLSSLVGLVSLCLSCLRNYQETCAEGSVVDGPCLSLDCCHTTVRVIRSKAVSTCILLSTVLYASSIHIAGVCDNTLPLYICACFEHPYQLSYRTSHSTIHLLYVTAFIRHKFLKFYLHNFCRSVKAQEKSCHCVNDVPCFSIECTYICWVY